MSEFTVWNGPRHDSDSMTSTQAKALLELQASGLFVPKDSAEGTASSANQLVTDSTVDSKIEAATAGSKVARTAALSLSSDNVLTITLSNGATSSVSIPKDTNTKYGISYSNGRLTLIEGGTTESADIPNSNTTYTLAVEGHKLTLKGNDSTESSITLPDNNTEYGLSFSEGKLMLVPGGSSNYVNIPDKNTTYSLSISGHNLTLKSSDSAEQSVTLPDNDTKYGLKYDSSTEQLTLVESGADKNVTIKQRTYGLEVDSSTKQLTLAEGGSESSVSIDQFISEGVDEKILAALPIGSIVHWDNGCMTYYEDVEIFDTETGLTATVQMESKHIPQSLTVPNGFLACDGGSISDTYKTLSGMLGGKLPLIDYAIIKAA